MATQAQVGLGTILNRWNGSAWVEIVEVVSLSWGGPTRNVIDVAKLNTPDEYINKLQGMLDAGTVTASIMYVLSQYNTLRNDLETRGNQMYQIAFPDGEGIEFEGFVSEIPMEINTDDAMQGDVVFVIDGKADFVSAVS